MLTSLALHVGAIAILLIVASLPVVRTFLPPIPSSAVHPLLPAPYFRQQGGGGQRNPLPASKGQAPPKAIAKVFIPPMVERLEAPKLPVLQGLLETPEINVNMQVTGDPLGAIGPPSGGPGFLGIGDGGPGGIGNDKGPRLGGFTSNPVRVAGITQQPKLLHADEPEYSEAARKARYQGTVILAIDVDTSGRATNIRVTHGLGLGLDEKAIDAVKKWVFRPAMAAGRPVIAPAQVEVTFHLL